ncbi:Flp pilus assembly complex ATPase component TadA [Patescibacteria group bacterium]|nr:Flp pilus assembly complex ATPase component TadA [Patescibacteria group bacterium]MBU1029205.1 Flp pilus assembly complex ATPase component TadA [Patescibacteria group bacterium]
MPNNQETKLLDILLETGKLDETQYSFLVEEQKRTSKSFEELLLERKLVDEDFLTKVKGTILGVPYVDLMGKEIKIEVLNLLPREVAETNQAIAFDRTGDDVSIGMVNPRDMRAAQAIDFLSRTRKFKPHYYVISSSSYVSALKKYKELGKEVAQALEVAKEKYEVPAEETEQKMDGRLEDVIKGAPVSRIVSVIIRHAVEAGASDIHVEPYGDESRVRYRVDGVLRTSLSLPKYILPSIVSRIKVLANLKLDETRIPQDGRIRDTVGDKIIDFRVSTLPLTGNEKVVMRILDTTKGVPKLHQLGFRPRYVRLIEEQLRQPHGMFLITGPTGAGKSTTLFTILDMRNEEGVNICTLEDPVEYQIRGVNQSQIRPEVGFTFATGLRALLRQDPNVIMVGEIRDSETAELAIHAALTGHLIFSTLHTNNALGVIPRLVDMQMEPFLLSATMNIAVAQRLCRKICERCKAATEIPPEVEQQVRSEIQAIPDEYFEEVGLFKEAPLTLYKGRGCLRCQDTGYAGRVAVAEILVFDDQLRYLVTKGFPVEAVRKVLQEKHMIDIRQDAILKALEGLTTIEEVMRVTAD